MNRRQSAAIVTASIVGFAAVVWQMSPTAAVVAGISAVTAIVLGVALPAWGNVLVGDIQADLGEDPVLDHRGDVVVLDDWLAS